MPRVAVGAGPSLSSPLLSKSRDELVEALSDVPPKPAAMEQILRINQGREEATS